MSDAGVMASAPVVRRVRAYAAVVDRSGTAGTVFDPAQMGTFDVDAPPAPWVDLGWVKGFARRSGTKIEAVRTGAPAAAQMQVRSEVEASVAMEFETWGKLQLSLACGTQQMNLLVSAGADPAGSGGAGVGAVAVADGSTATSLTMGDGAGGFMPGQWVVVDVDYAGQVGFVGAGMSGAYVRTPVSDVDYVRRISLNVARVASVASGVVTLETPLPAGDPASGMSACAVVGFCDRDGSSFFQEWAGLFVLEGQQGDRVIVHYPRLQAMRALSEGVVVEKGLETMMLAAEFRALPVVDAVDGERVVCFRSYLPA